MAWLRATLRLPGGPRQLRVGAGGGLLLDGPDAAAVIAALTGMSAGGAAPGRGHRILLDGRRLHRRSPAARVRHGLGMLVGAPVAPAVTVLDHLAVRAGRARAEAALAAAPALHGRGHVPAGILSGGERRVLAWLRCALSAPRAVVLDAPGTGLDPGSLAWAEAQVTAWLESGVAVVLRPGRPEERRWFVDA